ncbi:RagB/SusD family nutrient uptake outer membrane protein [Pedobacter rhodius]|uniref:RagB/SusD family nutrient uptake outer membrane protein n=1 Tax=Pedobacter rhodius TaxID=3004098 RepID=A0ABT4KTB2_9SPHI|nr:RagB/SusD family nutrient uptake outer membrane protein [Pedobacter sp. SJ11]MCZ4222172.1 RagB/SusD family nutrient uptake outer membrane protein [Pedobacter sp. SJ11]
MRKYILIILIFIGLASCKKAGSYLDQQNVGQDANVVFTDSVRTLGFLNGIYAGRGFSFNKGRWDSHGNLEEATDDAEYRYSGAGQYAVILYSGNVSPLNVVKGTNTDFYVQPYLQIRAVNLFLSKLPTTPLAQSTQRRVAAEARFLRAWYYHYLVKTFGGIPILGDKIFDKDDIIDIPRSNYEDCVNYIVSECDAVAAILPVDQLDQDYGRITKGMCLALKSRVLLTAASPLFNGGGIVSTGPIASIIAYPTYDASRWAKAAQAAKDVIDMNKYALVVDNTTAPGYGFYKTFISRANSEMIFTFTQAPNKDFEGHFLPPSRSGGFYSTPTQNLVDQFDMLNGKQITDPTSGYNPANPYINRDPRFGYTVIYNGSSFANNSNAQAPVFTYVNAPSDGNGIGTTSGYYGRKMCDVNVSYGGSANADRGYPLLRYAEILLNYAEALNEMGQTADALANIFKIRERAGILAGSDGRYGIKTGVTQAELRTLIQKERRTEMAFEDVRFYDERRWKIAEITENGFNKIMLVTPKTGTTSTSTDGSTYNYQITSSIRKHNFRPANYLMPIPQSEILKLPSYLQNPGY